MSGRGPRGRARNRSDTVQAPNAQVAAEAESGRGRGLPPVTQPVVPVAAGGSPTGSGSGSGGSPTSGNGNGSDKSHDSPPQPSVGRAATRGKTSIQPLGIQETGLIDPISRLSLKEGEQPEHQRRREIDAVPYMRPPSCLEKRGKLGDRVSLMANYFEAINKPNWLLYQYHVDFNPQIDSRRMRQAMLHQHNNLFPDNKAFDGSTLYSLTKLPNEVTLIEIQSPIMILLYIIFLFQTTNVVSVRESDKEQISIKIKLVCEIIPASPQFVHLFNIVFKRYLFLGIYQEI